MMDHRTDRFEIVFGDQQIRPIAVSTNGVGVGMFDEQQVVVRAASGDPALPQRFLKIPRFVVWKPTEPADSNPSGMMAGSFGHASS
jgi:hypothetical protein